MYRICQYVCARGPKRSTCTSKIKTTLANADSAQLTKLVRSQMRAQTIIKVLTFLWCHGYFVRVMWIWSYRSSCGIALCAVSCLWSFVCFLSSNRFTRFLYLQQTCCQTQPSHVPRGYLVELMFVFSPLASVVCICERVNRKVLQPVQATVSLCLLTQFGSQNENKTTKRYICILYLLFI